MIRSRATDAKEKGDKLELKAGMNRFDWDLRYEGAKEVPGMILWGSTLSGPRVVPGRHMVKLIVGSGEGATTQSKEFDIRKDPRSSASAQDLQAQVAFLLEGRDKLTQAHEAILRTRAIRDQVGGVSKKAEGDALEELRTLGDKIKADVTAIEETLYQTKNKSGQDPLNFPIRLNDKLGNVLSVVSAGDNAPTQQAIAVKAELTVAIDAQLDKLNALVSLDLSKFNRLAAEAGIPHVLVEEKAK